MTIRKITIGYETPGGNPMIPKDNIEDMLICAIETINQIVDKLEYLEVEE